MEVKLPSQVKWGGIILVGDIGSLLVDACIACNLVLLHGGRSNAHASCKIHTKKSECLQCGAQQCHNSLEEEKIKKYNEFAKNPHRLAPTSRSHTYE